jgi:hypothetical protein
MVSNHLLFGLLGSLPPLIIITETSDAFLCVIYTSTNFDMLILLNTISEFCTVAISAILTHPAQPAAAWDSSY